MYHQLKQFSKFLLVVGILSVVIISCKRDASSTQLTTLSQCKMLRQRNNALKQVEILLRHILLPVKAWLYRQQLGLPKTIPMGTTRVATFYAVGVQKYKARIKAGSNPVEYEWVFVAPRPIFMILQYKSRDSWRRTFLGDLISRFNFRTTFQSGQNSTSPDAVSIDWLLLMPKAGTTPTGILLTLIIYNA
jgi:hypothetical protein